MRKAGKKGVKGECNGKEEKGLNESNNNDEDKRTVQEQRAVRNITKNVIAHSFSYQQRV